MPRLDLSFLGTFQARLDAAPLANFRSAKVESLLAYLAVESKQAHRREVLAALLWPDEAGPAARQNLRQAIYLLQQMLGREGASPFLNVTRESVQFNASSDHALDVRAFLAAIDAGELGKAIELYRGDLLAGLSCDSVPFQEWLYFNREHLHVLALNALDELAESALQQGCYADAQQHARRQIALEPWRESAHRQLMLALALNGERNAALEQYARCQQALAEELGAAPDPETTALVKRIRDGALHAIATTIPKKPAGAVQDWGEAPDHIDVFGRDDETALLAQWLTKSRCRLVTIIGMGGIGKTTLAATACRQIAGKFDCVIWRSLVNAPPLSDVLQSWMRVLTGQQLAAWPEQLDAQLALVFEQLRARRCLLVLDNAESIMQGGDRAGHYIPGCENYGQLFKRMGESEHQSVLLVTSREQMREWSRLSADTPRVRSLALHGLDVTEGSELLAQRGLAGMQDGAPALVERYSGNPLALKLVAQTIQDVFASNINAFLQDDALIFDDIRDVLDQQFSRLPKAERDILLWLAVEREPVSEAQLWEALSHHASRAGFVEALRSLGRRSLLENVAGAGAFSLQNVVIEYMTERLVTQAGDEIERGAPDVLHTHALILARAREYVRESQIRMILHPIAARLLTSMGRSQLEQRCEEMLTRLRESQTLRPGYCAGNLLNLLLHIQSDLAGADFSRLCVWQAYLRGADLPQVDFTGADLSGTVFTDYVGEVTAMSFSPDGRLLAAGADNGLIYLWQWDSLQLMGVCQGHEGHFGGLCFSPNGELLASAGDDGTVRIWEVTHRQPIHVLKGHTGGVTSVAFHPDGVTVASGSTDATVRVCDAKTGRWLDTLLSHEGIVSAMCFTPDGATLITTSHDKTIRLWDWERRQVQQVLEGHSGAIVTLSLCVQPARTLLATGSFDGTARIWDLIEGRLLATLTGHTAPVMAVAFSADGSMLMTGSDDQTIRVWDIDDMDNTAPASRVLTGHFGTVNALAVHPSTTAKHTLMISGSHDRTVRLWDAQSGLAFAILRGHSKWIQTVVFDEAGRLLAGGSDGRDVRVWDGSTGHGLLALRGHTSLTEKLSFSADGRWLASASWDRTARIWDVQSGRLLHKLEGHAGPVALAVLGVNSARGGGPHAHDLIATGGLDHTVRLWDAETGNAVAVCHGHTDRVDAFDFSRDGLWLASGSWDGAIGIWDTQRGNLLHFLRGHGSPIECVAFHPDGERVASGAWNNEVRIWQARTGVCIHVLNTHTSGLEAVQFSPDGTLLASCACDRLVCIWDVQSGRLLHKLEGHASWVRCIAFNRAGTRLASGSDDGTVQVWDVASGARLHSTYMQDPYAGMNIRAITGITVAQRVALKALGAVE